MGGVLSAASSGQAAVEFVRAGGDLCLICHREDRILEAHEALVTEAESNPDFARRVGESLGRVAEFKSKSARLLRNPKPPSAPLAEKLSRKLWEFSEQFAPGSAVQIRNARMKAAVGAHDQRPRNDRSRSDERDTSADGINVALVRFGGGRAATRAVAHKGPRGRGGRDHASSGNYIESGNNIRLLGHAEFAYPKKIRVFVLSAMNDSATSVADLARLNFLLGELYSDAILATQRRFRVKADLVGCHGQTLYHQGQPAAFLGHKIAATWQTGEAAIIAARTGVPVISDFRPADMAAGGKGAPLVPFLDYMLFRDAHIGRIVQNIGGIANLTAIPANAAASDVIAFDTGPGNMVIDAIMEKLFAKPFDRGGNIAASGKVLDGVVSRILRHKFFRTKPPKTAGREEFGRQFVEEFLRACENCRKEDAIATATALTAKSIADAVLRHVLETHRLPKTNMTRTNMK